MIFQSKHKDELDMISVFKGAYNIMGGGIIFVCTNYGQGSVVKGSTECELSMEMASPSVLNWCSK